MNKICWRCLKIFIPNPGTETCLYCGYDQDRERVIDIKVKQIAHDLTNRNPQSSGVDKKYRKKGNWSMKD